MADRDKVINALECCYCNFPKQMDCKNCPYDKICYHDKACSLMLRDALELLKEQEDLGTELTNAMELIHKKNERINKLEEQIETLTRWRANAGAFD